MNVAPVLMTKLEQGYQSPSLEWPNLGMERIIRRFRSSPISPRLRPCTRSNLHQPYHSSRSLILTALSLRIGFPLPRGLFRCARATTYQTLYSALRRHLPLVGPPVNFISPLSHRLGNEGPLLDKAPRLSISIVIWILSSDTICQFNLFHTNSEAAMLSSPYLWIVEPPR